MIEPGSRASPMLRLRMAACVQAAGSFGLKNGTLAIARTSPLRGSSTTMLPPSAPEDSTPRPSSSWAMNWITSSSVSRNSSPPRSASRGGPETMMSLPKASCSAITTTASRQRSRS